MEVGHVEIDGYDYDPERKRYFKKRTCSFNPPMEEKRIIKSPSVIAKKNKFHSLLQFIRSRTTKLECNHHTDR